MTVIFPTNPRSDDEKDDDHDYDDDDDDDDDDEHKMNNRPKHNIMNK